jgi:hypothetical protein
VVQARREVFLQAPSRRIAEAVRDAMKVLFDLSKKKKTESQSVPCSATTGVVDPQNSIGLFKIDHFAKEVATQ